MRRYCTSPKGVGFGWETCGLFCSLMPSPSSWNQSPFLILICLNYLDLYDWSYLVRNLNWVSHRSTCAWRPHARHYPWLMIQSINRTPNYWLHEVECIKDILSDGHKYKRFVAWLYISIQLFGMQSYPHNPAVKLKVFLSPAGWPVGTYVGT